MRVRRPARDLLALAQIDVAGGKLTYLETPEHEVEGVRASPRGRWLAWLLNVGGKSELRLRDLKNDKTQTLPGLPLGVVHQLEFAEDDSKLALVFDGPRHNMDVWICDLTTSKLRQLTHSSRAGIPFDQFADPELIHYKSFDERKIPAWYYPVPSPLPLSPAAGERGRVEGERALAPSPRLPSRRTGEPEPADVQPDLSVFPPARLRDPRSECRGSSGYGTTYMNLDNTTKRMDSVGDLAYAAYRLREEKKGDPKRLAVFGGSYGGFMVLAAVTNYPDLWAAGIDVAGICNFITFLEKTGAYRRAPRKRVRQPARTS